MPAEFIPRRSLGRTGFVATALGIGDVADRTVPFEQCVATVQRALDAGLNLVDTAPSYEDGLSEQIVGAALKGRRAGVFLIDKIDDLEAPVAPQIEASLGRLGCAPDLFVFHGVRTLEQWRRLRFDELAGQVRWRGISCHNPAVLREAIPSGRCDVVLFPVGPFVDERYIVEALPLARQHGVGTVAFKVFGAGKLLGNTTGYGQPLPATPVLPRLGVAECLHYTLTLDPDVALLGLSSPAEQDAAFAAYRSFQLLPAARLADIRARAAVAVIGKDRCWWNP